MNPLSKLLLVAALLVAVVGVGLAVVQPGDLGDSEAETAQPGVTEPDESSTSTSTTAAGGDSTTTTTTAAGGDNTTTTTTAPTAPTTTTTTAGGVAGGGSGLSGGDAAPADTEDGLANSGGTSLMAAALLAGLAGLAIRHRPTA